MQTEAEVLHSSVRRGVPLLWWQLVLIGCAVVVALSSVVIAYAEMKEAHYQRQANCVDRAQVGGSVEDVRVCLGLPAKNR